MSRLGNRIKEYRKQAGLKQSDVAKAVGVSIASISKWEGGMELSFNNAASLARCLSISLDDLHYGGNLINEEAATYTTSRIPIVGTTQAGPNKEWFDLGYPCGWSDEYIDYPAKSQNVYALKVAGNSMAPRILEGEAVVINPNSKPAFGEEVVVKCTSGEVMVKVLVNIQNDDVILDSYNTGFDRIIRKKRDIEFIHPVISVARMSSIKQNI